MKKNVGILDRNIRFIVAILLLVNVYLEVFPSEYNVGLIIIAILIAISGWKRVCLLYKPFKIKTCKEE
ncbi:MAG: hypothetical protein RIR51_782 [Bacteroidota bacterium]|jgi:hypothetical protein